MKITTAFLWLGLIISSAVACYLMGRNQGRNFSELNRFEVNLHIYTGAWLMACQVEDFGLENSRTLSRDMVRTLLYETVESYVARRELYEQRGTYALIDESGLEDNHVRIIRGRLNQAMDILQDYPLTLAGDLENTAFKGDAL